MGKDNDEAAGGFGSVFRDRLTYLMNGNNVYGKPVNTQELADEIDISRPAVRKYLKPNDRREVTVPSALVVSRIARYFRTTPNFLLGFDEAADDADAQRAGESDVYSSLGLSQEAIDGLHRLHAQAVTDPKAADLQRLRDKLICSYVHEADKVLCSGTTDTPGRRKTPSGGVCILYSLKIYEQTAAQVDLTVKKAYD